MKIYFQIITGQKFIYNDFTVKDIVITDSLYSKNINDINILELNNTMVRKTGDYQIGGLKVIEADVDVDYLFVSTLHIHIYKYYRCISLINLRGYELREPFTLKMFRPQKGSSPV